MVCVLDDQVGISFWQLTSVLTWTPINILILLRERPAGLPYTDPCNGASTDEFFSGKSLDFRN